MAAESQVDLLYVYVSALAEWGVPSIMSQASTTFSYARRWFLFPHSAVQEGRQEGK